MAELLRHDKVAEMLGIAAGTLAKYVRLGIISPGSFRIEKKFYWTEKDIEKVKAEWKEFQNLVPWGRACLEMMVSKHRAKALLTPAYVMGKKSYLDRRLYPVYKQIMDQDLAEKNEQRESEEHSSSVYHEKRLGLGFYSVSDVARLCEVAACSVVHHFKTGRFPKPSHSVPGYRGKFYNHEEFLWMQSWLATNRVYGTRLEKIEKHHKNWWGEYLRHKEQFNATRKTAY